MTNPYARPTVQPHIEDLPTDCGLQWLGYSLCRSWIRCATAGKYLTTITLFVFFQTASQRYFFSTLESRSYNIPKDISNWLWILSGFVHLTLSTFVGYRGGKRNKNSWIAFFGILQGIFAVLLALINASDHYNFQRPSALVLATLETPLCDSIHGAHVKEPYVPFHLVKTAVLFLLQVSMSLGSTALLALGLGLLDESVTPTKIPACIGVVVGSSLLGLQTGLMVGKFAFHVSADFNLAGDIVWLIIGLILMVVSFIVALYPNRLVTSRASTLIRNSPIYRNNRYDFRSTLGRIFSNKLILSNIAAIACVYTVLINMLYEEPNYMESVFFVPKHTTDATDQNTIIIDFLRYPLAAVCVFLSGVLICITQPRATLLAAWNIGIICVVTILVFTSMFLRCSKIQVHNQITHKSDLNEFCNKDCNCPDNIPFEPVCSSNSHIVYYSPCHAGCRTQDLYSRQEYVGCACVQTESASKRACYDHNCHQMNVGYQSISVLILSLLGTCIVGTIILLLRSVEPDDRTTALGFAVTFICLMGHVPGKILYLFVGHLTCILYDSNDQCRLNGSATFSTYLSLSNICILMTSAALYACVCLMSRPLRPYGTSDSAKKFIVNSVSSPLSPLTPPGFEERAPTPTRKPPKRRPSDLSFSASNTNIDFTRHTDDYSPRSPGTTLREGGVLTTLL
ncbi:solute carrier organic anion transporter family member 2A1-like [Rhopalosiphum maidis]|uniref:solute carrier organic anion transporter family member 2A1-like n=1 Tax=Rhopalosiphum maidis TaxID=43146 RepID=UPI000EFF636B|nr:solute carrier organic anion transporter family member 2A1-like [Rhopalosiphum maidis]XP_060839502.1 solute carrier organic anion transporter family member 74D-like [Rhopalosiphum padi]